MTDNDWPVWPNRPRPTPERCNEPCEHVLVYRSRFGSIAIVSRHTYVGKLVHVVKSEQFPVQLGTQTTQEFLESMGWRKMEVY